MPTLSIKHGAVKYRVPQAEVEALHRRVQLEAAGIAPDAPETAAPAAPDVPQFTGVLTTAARDVRLTACRAS